MIPFQRKSRKTIFACWRPNPIKISIWRTQRFIWGCDVQAAETLLPEEHNYVTPKRTASPQIMKQKDQKNNRRKDDVAQKMSFYEECFRQEDPEILEKTKAKRSHEQKV